MKLSRRAWVFSGIVMALMLGIFWIWPASDLAKQLLPDGSVLTLRTATYQTRHRIRTDGRLLDHLGMGFPESLAKKLACRFAAFGGQTNALDISLAWDRSQAVNQFKLRAGLFDEHGCEFKSVPPSGLWSLGAAQYVLTFQFTEFPRRSSRIGFRLYEQATTGSWSALAEFSVPNPDRRLHPVWSAERLPITKSVDGVDFTLLELKTGLAPKTDYPGASGASLSLRILENGRPTPGWEFSGIRGISDALGHTIATGYSSSSMAPREHRVHVNAGLCGEESAWKVEAEFARSGNFPDEDLWTIRAIPVPATNTASVVEIITNLHGAQFRFRGIVGVGCPEPKLRRSLSHSPVAHLVYRNLPAGLQVKFVAAVDDHGRKVPSSGSATEPPNYLTALRLAPDAKAVDLTFAVTKRVPVQFLVKPARINAAQQKNEASTKSVPPRN